MYYNGSRTFALPRAHPSFIIRQKIKRSIPSLSTYPFFITTLALRDKLRIIGVLNIEINVFCRCHCHCYRRRRILANHQFNWSFKVELQPKTNAKVCIQAVSNILSVLVPCCLCIWTKCDSLLAALCLNTDWLIYLLINDIPNLFANKWHAIFFIQLEYRSTSFGLYCCILQRIRPNLHASTVLRRIFMINGSNNMACCQQFVVFA